MTGLLVILAAMAGTALARTGRRLRQPTKSQVADVAMPVGRILARRLPIDIITPDLEDVTTAAAAIHAYVLDDDAGPLITRTEPTTPTYDLEDQ